MLKIVFERVKLLGFLYLVVSLNFVYMSLRLNVGTRRNLLTVSGHRLDQKAELFVL